MGGKLKALACTSLLAAFAIPAEAKQGESTTVEFPQAYHSAIAFARTDGVDFAEDQLYSLAILDSEFNAIADRSDTDDYSRHFREPLKGREYWLACFGPKELQPGGVRCYAFERGTLRLLSVHRSR
jgi:hypothetical protein